MRSRIAHPHIAMPANQAPMSPGRSSIRVTAVVRWLALILLSCALPAYAEMPTILVFSKTADFRHTAIEPGIAAIIKLGERNGFRVMATEDARAFTPTNLQRYGAVVFLCTTGDVLDAEQQRAFEAYVEDGGGYVGVHSAAATEYDWPWYGKLVGAWFDSHGAVQNAAVITAEPFGETELPTPWVRRDEWYNFKHLPQHVHVILKLDTKSFRGSKHPGNHPIAWYHEVGVGRAFYTGLGHTDESYSDPVFLAHLRDGIKYAIRPISE
jgi:type 1 glutamine amidotransferase